MIQIEIETMKAAVSELQSKRAILSQIKERMAKLSYAISQQSYVEELVWELNKLDMRMEEIEQRKKWLPVMQKSSKSRCKPNLCLVIKRKSG